MDFSRLAREGMKSWMAYRPDVVAFDTETTGLEFYDSPFCVTAAWRTPDGIRSFYFDLVEYEPSHLIVQGILQETPTLVGHNLKFDLQKALLADLLKRPALASKTLHDTEALAHLLDEHRRKGLKHLAHVLLGEDTDEETKVKEAKVAVKKKLGLKSEREIGYHMLPREVVVPYALKDAEFTLRLYELLAPLLARHPNLTTLYEMEMELSLVLLDMERAGFAVDLDYAERITKEYGRKILDAEASIEAIVSRPIGDKPAKGEFNPNSPKQVTEWFDEECGITLLSTDKAHLRSVEHPLAQALLELRHVTKLHSTYLLPLLHETRNGVIHPNFRQHGTKTGRMSSGGATA